LIFLDQVQFNFQLLFFLNISFVGIISSVVGNGMTGYSGDGSAAAAAQLNNVGGFAFDSYGNLYVSDSNNYVIRKVNMATGIITTVDNSVGSGYSPGYIAIDPCNNVYYTSSNGNTVRMWNSTSKIALVVAGGGPSPYSPTVHSGTSITLYLYYKYSGLRANALGNIYFSDTVNDRVFKMNGFGTSCRTRTSSPTPSPTRDPAAAGTPTVFPTYPLLTPTAAPTNIYGQILNFAGTVTAGFLGDGSAATSARLRNPLDIALDTVNQLLYIADSANCAVRVIDTIRGILSEDSNDLVSD